MEEGWFVQSRPLIVSAGDTVTRIALQRSTQPKQALFKCPSSRCSSKTEEIIIDLCLRFARYPKRLWEQYLIFVCDEPAFVGPVFSFHEWSCLGCPCSSCTHCTKWDPNESSMKNHIAMIVTNADALMEYTCWMNWAMASWIPRVYHLIFAIPPVCTRHWWRKEGFWSILSLREQWDVLGCPFLHPLQQLHPPPYLLRQVLQKLIHGQETVKSIYIYISNS